MDSQYLQHFDEDLQKEVLLATPERAAELLGIKRSTIYKKVYSKQLEYQYKFDKQCYFTLDYLTVYKQNHKITRCFHKEEK